MWGRHLVLDCSACDPQAVSEGEVLREFCADLVASIGMVAYGEPVLEHFATHLPEAAGYSLVQLIETSAVTGHFCDASGDAYLDIFSCKDFDPEVAIEMVRRHLRPKLVRQVNLYRSAPRILDEAFDSSEHTILSLEERAGRIEELSGGG
jgi:S-adenosylmethionine decarboxylase